MLRLLGLGALSAALLAGPALAGKPDAEQRLAQFEKTGKTVTCLSPPMIDDITPLSDTQFLVRVGVSQYYLNETHGKCSGAASSFNRLQYTIHGGMLCENQIVTIVDNSTQMPGGACALGVFQELKKKPAEEKPVQP
ncbi:MAG: hypothetical protein GC153_01945 [Alphaproteobacteria bacterium]|nr:hypothetical protein [Alphaproteobacteria bacterium]